jgi:hypothetical protein
MRERDLFSREDTQPGRTAYSLDKLRPWRPLLIENLGDRSKVFGYIHEAGLSFANRAKLNL